ncbi:glycosyltransferase [Algoriphagus sp.]|jgi:mannosyltransferase OCH1-like enzyme|uniref:glycosyltransferase n=1 Tax=Algoriphagus sp. TaxID=1872435 RepID=UPI002723650F|nr:glycosyltransferase [Algoriphagus sp.]MDO8965177.1 glycosyltransferase [Algoriphagus sp.]
MKWIMKRNNAIQTLWIGSKLTKMELLSLKSFLFNSHEIHLYLYEELEDLPKGVTIHDANKIIPAEKIFKYKNNGSYAGFANLFRYKLLLEKGGIWSDLDIICIKPISIAEDYLFASERLLDESVQVNNCFIKAPENSPVIEYCYNIALNKNPEELHWGETGPKLLTRAVLEFGLEEYVADPEVICPLDYWKCSDLVTKPLEDIISEETYTVHLWNEMWRRNSLNKSMTFGPNCAYEVLHNMFSIIQ